MNHIYTRKTAYHESWISNKITEAKSRLFDRGKITRRGSTKDRGKILLASSSLRRDLEFTRRRARSILSVAQRSSKSVRLSPMEQITIDITCRHWSLLNSSYASLLFRRQRSQRRQLRRRRPSTAVRNHRKTGASARKTKCGFIDFTLHSQSRSLPR